ncbi:hypothetical protein [Sphingosinicella soli]|uniref:DUF2946 domain-containing protein n=1 Tax=Sphingosinicella soli TaxID=333708 RepID=A0A7W7B0C1_9SPHN|nr:hypothetical protein [Sphingosinicella soli]MBB4631674.1 hypothetical protein [Sphingosinicella soli]
MGSRIDKTQLGWELFALLAFCALLVRAIIPTGYMPTVSSDGIVMTLCTGSGAIEAFVPYDDDDGGAHPQPAEGACVFAMSMGGLLTIVPLLLAARIMASIAPRSRAIADLTVHRLAAPPPPAHGPPAHA